MFQVSYLKDSSHAMATASCLEVKAESCSSTRARAPHKSNMAPCVSIFRTGVFARSLSLAFIARHLLGSLFSISLVDIAEMTTRLTTQFFFLLFCCCCVRFRLRIYFTLKVLPCSFMLSAMNFEPEREKAKANGSINGAHTSWKFIVVCQTEREREKQERPNVQTEDLCWGAIGEKFMKTATTQASERRGEWKQVVGMYSAWQIAFLPPAFFSQQDAHTICAIGRLIGN